MQGEEHAHRVSHILALKSQRLCWCMVTHDVKEHCQHGDEVGSLHNEARRQQHFLRSDISHGSTTQHFPLWLQHCARRWVQCTPLLGSTPHNYATFRLYVIDMDCSWPLMRRQAEVSTRWQTMWPTRALQQRMSACRARRWPSSRLTGCSCL